MFNKFKETVKKVKSDRRFSILFALYLVTTISTFFVFIYWGEQIKIIALVVSAIGLALLTIFTWSLAALAVFRSLMVISAGLSLILFIAQSYCDLDVTKRLADGSLRSLIGISIVSIGVTFVVRLRRELFGDPEGKREFDKVGVFKSLRDANDGKDSILILFLYASFMGLILGQLFQVLYPIFQSLCVYSI